jgi:multiple sugar transport system substrate-binding protein
MDSTYETAFICPDFVDPGRIDGKQYLLPKDYSPLAVYYNKKSFCMQLRSHIRFEGWTWEICSPPP